MEIAERRRRSQALTRPELAVLLAYAKLSLNHELVQSSVPDDPYLGRELGRYFPKAIAEQFPDALEHHRLRREIIATQLANSMINRGGPSLLVRIGRSDRRAAGAHRRRLRRRARQLRHDRAQRRDRRARQQDFRQAAARALSGGRGPACSTVWSGSCATSTWRRGWPRSSRIIARAIAAVEAALDTALPEAAAAARTGREADLRKQGVPRRACAPSRRAAGARRRARHRAGRRPHRAGYRRGRGHLFRGRGVLSSRSHRQRRARHRHFRLFRSARARPRARFDRRRRAAAHRRHGGQRRRRRRRRWKPGSRRARPRSTASAWRSTRSPIPG